MCVFQVNTQLYSGREKDDLAHLVRVMVNYNLIYKQERTPEGQYTYTLEPYVFVFWNLSWQTYRCCTKADFFMWLIDILSTVIKVLTIV